MKALDALLCEFLKLRRSVVIRVSFAAWAAGIFFIAFFMWIVMNPGAAATFGLIGDKASFTFGGEGKDWAGYLHVNLMLGAVLGVLFSSIILAWIFGREYVEGTAKNFLALPIGRWTFVAAKVVVAACWLAALLLLTIAGTWLAGTLLALPGWSPALFGLATARLLFISLMSFFVALPVAWIAEATRGYFGPMGYAIGTMFVANFFSHTGWAPWCPWTIVLLAAGPGFDAAATSAPSLGWGSWLVVTATAALGIVLAIFHVERADNAQ
ncbi:MAG TPA: ABC transporter permease [Rectinemataceae bacterium]|nr:ABC transporter permease [Rectinemataceae bacterium]